MFWSLVRPDRISPLRCEVRIVGDEKKAIVDALNAPMDEARQSSPSHGENRGSSPLRSANDFNKLDEVGRAAPARDHLLTTR